MRAFFVSPADSSLRLPLLSQRALLNQAKILAEINRATA